MRYLCSLFFFFVGFSSLGYAQIDTLGWNSGISGQNAKIDEFVSKLPVRQEPRITDLLIRHSQINQKRRGTNGYRLEIFSVPTPGRANRR